MSHHTQAFLLAAALLLPVAPAAQAAEMYPWRQHAHPFTFAFGNHIDSHQQTRQRRDGSLDGYLYIRYTGVVTRDNYRVATHADCNMVADCVVGWTLEGRPASAKLVRQPMHDHPLFWLGRADIPQPGGFLHFHWTGMAMPMPYNPASGYLLELSAVNRFCFIHHGAEGATAAASCRGNGGVAIERGPDSASHLNVITNDPAGM